MTDDDWLNLLIYLGLTGLVFWRMLYREDKPEDFRYRGWGD